MKLGIPFSTYIIAFEVAMFASVLAAQCLRRLSGSLYARVTEQAARFQVIWQLLYLLGTLAWLPLVVLPFLQFKLLTALLYVAGGMIVSALVAGFYFGLRRDVEELIYVARFASAVAVVLTSVLWVQAYLSS